MEHAERSFAKRLKSDRHLDRTVASPESDEISKFVSRCVAVRTVEVFQFKVGNLQRRPASWGVELHHSVLDGVAYETMSDM